jgi:SpoIID/LytB domain protein
MRRIRPLALVVAVSAALVPVVSARAASSFTFYGSGWGHGLGLSQWGAYGLAKAGWSYEQILTHFYSGTRVRPDDPAPGDIRVGLTEGERRIHLTAEGGPVHLWLKAPEGKPVADIPAGATWVVHPVGGAYEILDGTGAVVGGHPWGEGSDPHLFATYAGEGSRVTVPEGGATYNRGVLGFDLTTCSTTCSMRLVLQLPFEEYLLGIGEVPSSWPMEALRAQAVAARSYALYKLRNTGLQQACGCDVLDGSNDQVYIGWDKEGGTDGKRWVKAVTTTAGRIVSYQGKVALTVFTASDGGHTEDIDVQWGTPLASFPYLAGVCDPGEDTTANPWTDWNRSFSVDALTTALRPYTGDIGPVVGFGAIDRGVSGRIADAVVHGQAGDGSVTGTELRSALALPDDRVWINADKNVLGGIRTEYDALMCRPGVPTTVAAAVPGGTRQRFTDGAIYDNAAAAATVWLRGPVYDEYVGIGGATGRLGLPVADPVDMATHRTASCPDGCSRVDFVHGRIYWKAEVGAFALWGDVLAAYLDADGARGALGFPTSRVQHGANDGTSATFEHGTITCGAAEHCRIS